MQAAAAAAASNIVSYKKAHSAISEGMTEMTGCGFYCACFCMRSQTDCDFLFISGIILFY